MSIPLFEPPEQSFVFRILAKLFKSSFVPINPVTMVTTLPFLPDFSIRTLSFCFSLGRVSYSSAESLSLNWNSGFVEYTIPCLFSNYSLSCLTIGLFDRIFHRNKDILYIVHRFVLLYSVQSDVLMQFLHLQYFGGPI